MSRVARAEQAAVAVAAAGTPVVNARRRRDVNGSRPRARTAAPNSRPARHRAPKRARVASGPHVVSEAAGASEVNARSVPKAGKPAPRAAASGVPSALVAPRRVHVPHRMRRPLQQRPAQNRQSPRRRAIAPIPPSVPRAAKAANGAHGNVRAVSGVDAGNVVNAAIGRRVLPGKTWPHPGRQMIQSLASRTSTCPQALRLTRPWPPRCRRRLRPHRHRLPQLITRLLRKLMGSLQERPRQKCRQSRQDQPQPQPRWRHQRLRLTRHPSLRRVCPVYRLTPCP